ncbi:S8 family serine peptidase [Thalassotalea nanhaiensis]|uniref:S8 family serine peptidase n=1 Tax=Thalassotalea nanhaiensis TaxID=3065648 RepID=A0ABY9TIS8_9GAMM|nr:S8 family serine peptidase [Colwelliaceae bacterium SQ345]
MNITASSSITYDSRTLSFYSLTRQLFKYINSFYFMAFYFLLLCATFAVEASNNKLNGLNHNRVLDEYIVTFNITDTQDIKRLIKKFGGTYKKQFQSTSGIYVQIPESSLEDFSKHESVELVEANLIVEKASYDWGLDRLNQSTPVLDGNVSTTLSGDNISVYMLDTGINFAHEAFNGNATPFWDYTGGSGSDCNGHGTHTAGTVNNVVPLSQLYSVKVLDCSGNAPLSTVLSGIDAVLYTAPPAQITDVVFLGFISANSSSLDNAVTNLISAGYEVVTMAGNSNNDACNFSPAHLSYVRTIGSLGKNDVPSAFTNYGSCIDMSAPGEDILSAAYFDNSLEITMSGSSMAAAYITGVLAGYLSQGMTWDNLMMDSMEFPSCMGGPCRIVVLQQNSTLQTIDYQYDAKGRLKNIKNNENKDVTYSYDDAGNRTQVKEN